jgi:hypothetical protein
MQVNSNTILLWVAAILGYVWYSVKGKRDQIYCTLIRKDKTRVHLWRKKNSSGRVELDGGWFYYNAKTVTHDWLNTGIYYFMPIYVPSATFRWGNQNALNPETFTDDAETPQMRKNLDKEEDLSSWRKSGQQAMGSRGKTSMLEAYMPIITVCGFAIVGYFIYVILGKINMLGAGQNALQNMLGQLLSK